MPAPAAATGGVNTDGMWTNPFAAAPAGGAGTGTGTGAGQASADADDGYDTKEEGGALLNVRWVNEPRSRPCLSRKWVAVVDDASGSQ